MQPHETALLFLPEEVELVDCPNWQYTNPEQTEQHLLPFLVVPLTNPVLICYKGNDQIEKNKQYNAYGTHFSTFLV